jgi:AraC-like DNA-binding protein
MESRCRRCRVAGARASEEIQRFETWRRTHHEAWCVRGNDGEEDEDKDGEGEDGQESEGENEIATQENDETRKEGEAEQDGQEEKCAKRAPGNIGEKGLMAGPVGVGDLVAWNGGVLLIGRSNRIIPQHAHQAIQVVFGYEGPVLLRTSDDAAWGSYPLGIVASRQPHSMDATASTFNAIVFVEPETTVGRAITERYVRQGIASADDETISSTCTELFTTWLGNTSREHLVTGATRVISALVKDVAAANVTDHRIIEATAYIQARLGESVTLDDVAAHVFLSADRFRHLFVEQTGMGLRPYVLWRRFILAWDLLAKGESISSAAHGAGFADSAHFTRTSRQMFGFAPSLMQVDAGVAGALTAR